MRIATWNVNSIRSRIDRVEAWLARTDVDVLLMQETKAKDEQFPRDRFRALGYEVATIGYDQWNGVALISRVGLDDVEVGFPAMPGYGDPVKPEARAISSERSPAQTTTWPASRSPPSVRTTTSARRRTVERTARPVCSTAPRAMASSASRRVIAS